MQEGNQSRHSQGHGQSTARRRSHTMHQMRNHGRGIGWESKWRFMNSNAKCVAILARSADQLKLKATFQRPTARLAQYLWNVFGHWVAFHSRVKVGDINENLCTGLTHRGGQRVGHAQKHA